MNAPAFGRDIAPLGREENCTGYARGAPLQQRRLTKEMIRKQRQIWEKNCLKGKVFSICEKNIDLFYHNYLKSADKRLYPQRHMDCILFEDVET